MLDNKDKLEIWKKILDTQVHFNDLCLRVRNYAITILGVMLGAAALSYNYGGYLSFGDRAISVSIVFIFLALLVWLMFYLMDRYWYHELLRGAVYHNKCLEEKIAEDNDFAFIQLAKAIESQSHAALKVKAGRKLDYFYLIVACALFSAIITLLFFEKRSEEMSINMISEKVTIPEHPGNYISSKILLKNIGEKPVVIDWSQSKLTVTKYHYKETHLYTEIFQGFVLDTPTNKTECMLIGVGENSTEFFVSPISKSGLYLIEFETPVIENEKSCENSGEKIKSYWSEKAQLIVN